MYTIQQLSAPNDGNGNPRRLFLVHSLANGEHAGRPWVFDEGYCGSAAVPVEIREDAVILWPLNIDAAEYKRLLSFAD